MKLIIAQGNPGMEYANTHHNIGWLALDYLAEHWQSSEFFAKPKFSAYVSEFMHHDERILLIKPTTFYNQTGQSVRAIMDFYKCSLDDILVIHDDITIPHGTVRTRRGGQDAGNNGLKSLHQHIGDDFWHIRIGTQTDLTQTIGATDFVLAKIPIQEKKKLTEQIFPASAQIVADFLSGHIEPQTLKYSTSEE